MSFADLNPMSGLGFWLIVIAMGLGNFFYRSVFIFVMEHITLSDSLKLVLRFIPVSVLAGLMMPAILFYQGTLSFPLEWLNGHERVLAACVAFAVALWKRSMILTILAGMTTLHILEYFFRH